LKNNCRWNMSSRVQKKLFFEDFKQYNLQTMQSKFLRFFPHIPIVVSYNFHQLNLKKTQFFSFFLNALNKTGQCYFFIVYFRKAYEMWITEVRNAPTAIIWGWKDIQVTITLAFNYLDSLIASLAHWPAPWMVGILGVCFVGAGCCKTKI